MTALLCIYGMGGIQLLRENMDQCFTTDGSYKDQRSEPKYPELYHTA